MNALDGTVVVTGEALIDLVLARDGSLDGHPGGGPYNVARTIGRLEQPVAYLGRVSSDGFGRRLLLALESDIKAVDNAFLRDGLQSAVDGADPEELREILYGKIDTKRAADKQSAKFFADMGGYAPTIGIIGTVIGLIHVLENLSEPEKLGHLIAGAFVATLWGVLSANVLWLPIASRLKRLSEIECQQMELALEGVLAIQSGTSPRVVAEKLTSLLPPGTLPEQKAA